MNNDFWSLVMRFANDLHPWLRHSRKSLANRLTRDKNSLFKATHALFYMSYNIHILLCCASFCCGFNIQNPWWRHQMEKFSALLALCVNSPHKGQWRGNLMFSLICTCRCNALSGGVMCFTCINRICIHMSFIAEVHFPINWQEKIECVPLVSITGSNKSSSSHSNLVIIINLLKSI